LADEEYWLNEGHDALKSILEAKQNDNVAKNIIVFVGDGLGISVSTAARIYKGQKRGRNGEEERLNFEKFPHVSLLKVRLHRLFPVFVDY
jgi:alkaline phosphatase